MRRIPIESAAPIVVFAIARLAVAVVALAAVAVVDFPDQEAAALVLGIFVAWSIAVLVVARRQPDRIVSPMVAAGDFALLLALELAAPDAIGAVRFAALFLIAAHAHFQGERRGLAVAAIGSTVLVLGSALRGDSSFDSDLMAFYEAVFILSALATSVVVGLLRTSESASRLRARGLSRRTMQAESEVRRRVAESIHDGPVQELIGLDMILSAAHNAAAARTRRRGRRPHRRGARARHAQPGTPCATRSSTSAPTPSRRSASTSRSRTACRSGSAATASRSASPSSGSTCHPR